jgi:hypothetical protein
MAEEQQRRSELSLANAQMKEARRNEDRENPLDTLRQGWPRDQFGNPLLMYAHSNAEVTPTQQFGNATTGPVTLTAFIVDGPDEQVLAQMRRVRDLVERSLAEDREVLYTELKRRAAGG